MASKRGSPGAHPQSGHHPLQNVDARRIVAPNFVSISSFDAVGKSSYHAMQLSVNKRLGRGHTLLANHPYGKSLDIGSDETGVAAQNPLDLRPEKGLSGFDVRQRSVASFLWQLPSPRSGARKIVLGGRQCNGIFTIQSGTPFNVGSGRDQALTGTGVQRPSLVGNPRLDTGRARAELLRRYFDPNAFVLPLPGSFGNSGRNILVGPGADNLDFSAFKSYRMVERTELQFRAECFNILNHANLSNPVSNISSLSVGQILSTSSPRILQFGLKLIY